jgi:anti-sigma regulatory factor (Ser/Thr protein kinase)
MGFSKGKIEEMLVAVGEAVTNAVVHGGRDAQIPDTDAVSVDLVIRNSDLTIAVTSPRVGWSAAPQARADVMAESGRGVLMMQNLTDGWKMRQGAEGTTVYLTWHLPRPRSGSPRARPPLSRSRRRRRAS